MFQKKVVKNILCTIMFFENSVVYEIMWKNIVSRKGGGSRVGYMVTWRHVPEEKELQFYIYSFIYVFNVVHIPCSFFYQLQWIFTSVQS